MDVKGASGEISERKKEPVTGHWKKGDPCYKEIFVKLCSTIGWKSRTWIVSREIFKQSVEAWPHFSLPFI